MNRIWLWLVDIVLTIRTIARGMAEDPLHFVLLSLRRLRLVAAPRRTQRPSLWLAYRWYLADRPEQAAEVLRQLPTAGVLAARLAVALGMRRATHNDPPRVRALDLGAVGALSDAIQAAPPGSALRTRLISERDILAPGNLPAAPGLPHHPPQRVLFVLTNSLPYTRSGYTQRSHHMLTALAQTGLGVAAVTRLGYPTTIGIPGAPSTAVVDGIEYHRLATARLPLSIRDKVAAQADRVTLLADRFGTQLLHCTTDYTNALVTAAAARNLNLPWVYEMRGQLELTWITSRPQALQGPAAASERVRLLRAKEAELAATASAVIVLSEVQRADLVERGVPAEHITVVPNGVDQSLLSQDLAPSQARRLLGLAQQGFWVGSVSSLVPYEGFDTLLRAVARCRGHGLDVRCALVGDGVSRPGLMALASQLGLDEATAFPGRVAVAQAQLWHQALDLFAVPRQDQQVTRVVTPLKPIEAMALGRPVLASDLPALAELVQAPGTGRCVPPEDDAVLAEAITQLATDTQQWHRYAQAGRRFAAGRTWQQAAATVLACYTGGKQ